MQTRPVTDAAIKQATSAIGGYGLNYLIDIEHAVIYRLASSDVPAQWSAPP